MFQPKKNGRLSRRAARLILLFWKPGMYCAGFSMLGLFIPPLYKVVGLTLFISLLGVSIGRLLILGYMHCPHCGRPQLMLRGQRPDHDAAPFYEDGLFAISARWKDPNGGYCMWCDCLMEYDDVE